MNENNEHLVEELGKQEEEFQIPKREVSDELRAKYAELYDPMKINFLKTTSALIAKEKGFDEKFRIDEKLMLVITELAEAIEADRLGKRAKVSVFEGIMNGSFDYEMIYLVNIEDKDVFEGSSDEPLENYTSGLITNISQLELIEDEIIREKVETLYFVKAYKEFIKDTFEAEIAGTLVRMGHFAGYLDITPLCKYDLVDQFIVEEDNFAAYCFSITANFNALFYHARFEGDRLQAQVQFALALSSILHMEINFDVDVWKHVDWELRYFKTRPYKHNKAY